MICKILLFSLMSFLTGADSATNKQSAELLFVGDAMQHQAQLDRAKEVGTGGQYDYSDCFTLIAPEITAADYAVCNLEVPLGGGPDYSGYPCFSAPDSYAQALKDAGFDLFLTANNHCLDRRDKAARRTIQALDSLQLDQIGTFLSTADRENKVPFIKNINGFKVGFLNYTYGTNGIPPQGNIEVAMIDRKVMADEIKKTREAGAEIIVVLPHWGIEYVLLPNKSQQDLVDFLVDQGVDLIIGGHPHVIQPMEIRHNTKENKDVLVVYSLGNFISNMKTADTRGGALVRAYLTRDEQGKAKLSHDNYDILFSAEPGAGKSNFKIYPANKASLIPANQQQHWELFKRGALKVFDAHNKGVTQKSIDATGKK